MNNEKINVSNKYCNVKSFSYDPEVKELIIDYKMTGTKKYHLVPATIYQQLLDLNAKKRPVGVTLRRELKRIKKL